MWPVLTVTRSYPPPRARPLSLSLLAVSMSVYVYVCLCLSVSVSISTPYPPLTCRYIDTPGEREVASQEEMDVAASALPLRRLGTPEDIGNMYVFCVIIVLDRL